MRDHNETIRQEFAKQASAFGKQGLTLSSQEYLAWMVGRLPLKADFQVLDVAAGTAHLSCAIAPHVQQVIAFDMTPEMLHEARNAIAKKGLQNVRCEEGDAHHLPYHDNTFDLVVSRLSLHHFTTPQIQLDEMVRVCKPDHMVGIIDLLSPDDEALREAYNHYERLRDPSHTTALTQAQVSSSMQEAGLSLTLADTRDIPVDFSRWVTMTGTDPQTTAAIQQALEQELDGGSTTGMRPYRENGALKFLQVWAVFIGVKPTS
jgi:ubiquinone/menaquinone biosynthesis C-methylase UbiE